ncbi:unnamed protein product [Blepharisma stoltei]|uniref:Uncharacterized protein n=1 Tax=Blepharisma stoltei TaxID=1481888 RepID=A0AAU9IC88_9CILI|nr:unnamed protein product [Blepharisma stoltei]
MDRSDSFDDLVSCLWYWQSIVWSGEFKETDLPILARQAQQFPDGKVNGSTLDMVKAIQEGCNYRVSRTMEGWFVDFANLIERKWPELEQDKKTVSFIDGILLGMIRKLVY